jgi:peptidyl-prolyl cis-trans isomerase D
MQVQHLTQSLLISDFYTPAELQRIFALENEQREVRYAVVPVARYAAAATVEEAAVKAWYDAHIADYQNPESVRLQYAEMRLEDVMREVAADAQGLQAYYEANKSRYAEEEKRHASHILVKVTDAVPEAAALAKAQALRAQLLAGKDFAALARQNSEDPGSAANGGDLGWAGRSAYVKPFADALYALKVGEISEPVRTQFGYHLIRLDEVRPGQARTLESARAEIEADYRRQRASELYGDRLEQLQQSMEDGSARDIAALAARFHMTTGEIATFTRSGGAPLGGSPDLVSTVFSDETLSGGRLGGPVALGQDRLVVVKVLEYHPATAKPLESVRAEVVAAVRQDAGARAARAAGEARVRHEPRGGREGPGRERLAAADGRARRSAAPRAAARCGLRDAAARRRQAGLPGAVARRRQCRAARRAGRAPGRTRRESAGRPAAGLEARAAPARRRSRGLRRRDAAARAGAPQRQRLRVGAQPSPLPAKLMPTVLKPQST